jgi:hypothetical protein
MRKEDINMLKLKKKNIYKKNQEVKSLILKSIVQNSKLHPAYKNYAFFMLAKRKKNFYKFKHICLKNNKSASVYNSMYLSKYAIKELMINGSAQNLKINSW